MSNRLNLPHAVRAQPKPCEDWFTLEHRHTVITGTFRLSCLAR
jgi:hypothetical protein